MCHLYSARPWAVPFAHSSNGQPLGGETGSCHNPHWTLTSVLALCWAPRTHMAHGCWASLCATRLVTFGHSISLLPPFMVSEVTTGPTHAGVPSALQYWKAPSVCLGTRMALPHSGVAQSTKIASCLGGRCCNMRAPSEWGLASMLRLWKLPRGQPGTGSQFLVPP